MSTIGVSSISGGCFGMSTVVGYKGAAGMTFAVGCWTSGVAVANRVCLSRACDDAEYLDSNTGAGGIEIDLRTHFFL